MRYTATKEKRIVNFNKESDVILFWDDGYEVTNQKGEYYDPMYHPNWKNKESK